MVISSDMVEIPHCGSCGMRRDVDLRMRLDTMGHPHFMFWCSECTRCVLYKYNAFITKRQIEGWDIRLSDIPQVD